MDAVGVLTAFVYVVGSIVCHQLPERSFHIAGAQLPVCARCTGLYVGGLVGIIAWLVRRHRTLPGATALRALAIAAIPTLVSVTTAQLGWWDPANALRAALALPLGAVTGAVLAAGLTRNLR